MLRNLSTNRLWETGMRISSVRSVLYRSARALGDVQAIEKAVETGSLGPVEKRLERRLLGRLAGRTIGRIVR